MGEEDLSFVLCPYTAIWNWIRVFGLFSLTMVPIDETRSLMKIDNNNNSKAITFWILRLVTMDETDFFFLILFLEEFGKGYCHCVDDLGWRTLKFRLINNETIKWRFSSNAHG